MFLLFISVFFAWVIAGSVVILRQAKGAPVSLSAWFLGIFGFTLSVNMPPISPAIDDPTEPEDIDPPAPLELPAVPGEVIEPDEDAATD